MFCLTARLISHIVPNYVARYECRRNINFLRKILQRKSVIRIPTDFNIKDYKDLYYFPQIAAVSGLMRLKYLKYGITLTIPLFVYFQGNGDVNNIFLGCLFLGNVQHWLCIKIHKYYSIKATSYFIFITYITHIGKYLIGKMYLHKDLNDICLSYLNCNGRRKNEIYKLRDIKVVEHPNILYKKFFKKVIVNNSYKEFNLCTFKTIKTNDMLFHVLFPNVN